MMQDARPPYVRFEIRQVEDRAKTLETGHFSSRDVIYVLVTQIGSSDTYENEAEAWLAMMAAEARAEPPRVPQQWVDAWKTKFHAYRDSSVNSVDGSALRDWPAISKAQVEACGRIGCFTVEDLAVLNEDGIAALGMGGRMLKEKAAKWLQEASEKGKIVQENVQLSQRTEQLEERNRSLEEQIRVLTERLDAQESRPKAK